MKKHPRYMLCFWVVFLATLYYLLSVLRHNNFQSGGYDLGIYDQAVWKYSRLLFPYSTIKERFILGDHLSLTLPLLSPLFYIWDNVRILLLFQAFWLSLSGIPVFLLAKLKGLSGHTSFILTISYGLFYGLQYAVLSDFHPVIIGVGLIPWIAYFLESNKKKFLVFSIIMLLATQENMGIALVSLGCIYIFQKKYRKSGLAFIIIGVLASLLAIKVVSRLSPISYEYVPKVPTTARDMIMQLFDTKEKREVWFMTFSQYAFLPLFSWGAVLAALVDLSQYFLAGTSFERMWSPYMHHRAVLGPFMILGVMIFFSKIQRKRLFKVFPALLLLSVIFSQYIYHFPLNKLSKRVYWETEEWMKDTEKLLRFLPSGASVASQQNIVPHLSHRKEIYLAWPRQHEFAENSPCMKKSCWLLDFAGKPKYLVVNIYPEQWVTQLLTQPDYFIEAVNNMTEAGTILLVKEVGYAKMYKIKY